MSCQLLQIRPEIATRLSFALHLLFTRCYNVLFTSLPLTIIREIYTYIGMERCYLAEITEGQLRVYDLRWEKERKTASIGLEAAQSGLIMRDWERLLVVGGACNRPDIYSVHIWTGVVTLEAHLHKGRSYPGLLLHNDFVWIFGGNISPSLRSVERFHNTTRAVEKGEKMRTPKVNFTPCTHKGLIYLPDASAHNFPLEVLDPLPEIYSFLPLTLYSSYFGSISFIQNDELVIFMSPKQVGRWEISSSVTKLSPLDVKIETECGSSGPVVGWKGSVYWGNGGLGLVKWDVERKTVRMLDFYI